jgi:bifunctional non-homologous end joining protein LigD
MVIASWCTTALQLCEHLAGDGAEAFAAACQAGLEGIVSKRRGSAYRSGNSTSWIKVRNPKSAALTRYAEGTW